MLGNGIPGEPHAGQPGCEASGRRLKPASSRRDCLPQDEGGDRVRERHHDRAGEELPAHEGEGKEHH